MKPEMKPEKIALDPLSTDEWLALRRTGIGASEAAAVLGVSPYASPLRIWGEKVGALAPPEETEAMRWGRLLEPVIADEYGRATGRTPLEDPRALYRSADAPWMFATPDRLWHGARQTIVVEIKTTGSYGFDPLDELPVHFQVQCQHQLYVLGLDVASLVILVGGQRLYWRDLERNDAFIRVLVERLRDFWRRVELLEPPEATADDREVLRALYPRDSGATIELPPEAADWDRELLAVREELRTLERRRETLEARLKQCIGEASYGRLPDGTRYSWRLVRQEIPPQPAQTREFRVLRRLTRGGNHG